VGLCGVGLGWPGAVIEEFVCEGEVAGDEEWAFG